MSINKDIIKQVKVIANKHSINISKFTDTDIEEFLNVFSKAIKKVNKKKQDESPAFPSYNKISVED